jgi:PDZ domain-containing protein
MNRPRFALALPVGRTGAALVFGPLWLLVLPALFAIAMLAAPLVAPALTPGEVLIVATGATLCIVLAVLLHSLAHVACVAALGGALPCDVPVELLGDAAQVWPEEPHVLASVVATASGPVTSLTIGAAALVVWNAQLHALVNVVALFAALVSGGLALLNLAPAWPLDGGRVAYALVARLLGRQLARRLILACSVALWLALSGWGVYLLTLGARFSAEVALGTLAAALLLLLGLRHHQPSGVGPAPPRLRAAAAALAWAGTGALLGALLLASASILPRLEGLYSPGPAVSVEPMVDVPVGRRTAASGELLLTTVVAQTPVTLGQWLYAQFSPAFALVPPERVVPRDVTPRELVQQNLSMLEESEATAIVVGMRLAGEQAELVSTAVAVSSVAPESPSAGLLLPGDIIVSVDGEPTPRAEILRDALGRHQAGDSVRLALLRDGQPVNVEARLMAPAEPGGPARIGVTLQPVGLDVDLAFPVSITTQKIVGGPSAGLMFTLAVYDVLTPDDLTKGWRIAGTGTIALDGTVGPIGGIAQKVAGAEWAGAQYFIVPREHEQDARRAARTITLIPVSTAQEAIAALRALPPKP